MNKDDIIENLAKKNDKLLKEVNFWKLKYETIERSYRQLLEKTKTSPVKNSKLKVELPEFEQTILDHNAPSSTIATSPRKNQRQSSQLTTQSPKKMRKQINQSSAQADIFDFFSENLQKSHEIPKNVCQLIEGCFIIQKISSIDHFDPLRFIYPLGKFDKIKNMFDVIYRFVFIDEKIISIEDDQFDSRKNQINFGAPCEDFQFVFDNISEKEGEKGRLNSFQKITHLLRKRYIYGVVRPEIILVDKQPFETQLAYGFISSIPFPNFFKDLNRIVQQELKFRMLNMNKDIISKTQKVDIISEILKDFTSKSLEKSLCVTSYPINLELKANICGLKLVYNTKSNFISDQVNYIEGFIHKYSLLKLIKIVHYVLTEQHIIIVCKSRKSLNQLFQIIRSIIYPFNWIFPIIYYYSTFFQPFLNSPMPIIIGYIQCFDQKNQNINPLPENDFITIFAQQNEKVDLNDIQDFEKRIKKCHKNFSKQSKKSKPQNQISKMIQKPIDERLTFKFYSYIKKFRQFIETGNLSQQIDNFHIQFMQSQMVSYYKQNLPQKPQIK